MLLLSYRKQYSIPRNKGEIVLINQNLKASIECTIIKKNNQITNKTRYLRKQYLKEYVHGVK